MKLGDLKGALLDSDFAMHDGDNVKALFRKGQVDTIPWQKYDDDDDDEIAWCLLTCNFCDVYVNCSILLFYFCYSAPLCSVLFHANID